jgi:hypothetical protein
MLQRLGIDMLMGKSGACVSFASCPPISMTNFLRAFAKKFGDISALVRIAKRS